MRIVIGLLFATIIAVWIVFSQIPSYRWASKAELALTERGITVVDRVQTGDLTLPWTWIWPITSQLNWQKNLHNLETDVWIITYGYISIDHENASWFALVDCAEQRMARAPTEALPENPSDWAKVAASIIEHGDGWQNATDVRYDFVAETIKKVLDRTCEGHAKLSGRVR